jgi:predicted phosphodiesterase
MAVEDEFVVAVLGDLHLDPRYMEDHVEGREHFKKILDNCSSKNRAVVSLGDLGESKSVDETKQLFAGTSKCFKLAREYLDGYGVPFEVVGGNHDLEGIDEYKTDKENLAAYLKFFDKPSAQFKRQIAHKTLLVGLGSTVFRDATYTSHEVFIDDEQVEWFEKTVAECPAADGWRIFVFTHAPPMGSGLRVLQENHVVNGCCWLNHSSKNTGKFIDIVRKNPCIKVIQLISCIVSARFRCCLSEDLTSIPPPL